MRKRTAEWSDSLVKQQRWITERTNVKEARALQDNLSDFLPHTTTLEQRKAWLCDSSADYRVGSFTAERGASRTFSHPFEDDGNGNATRGIVVVITLSSSMLGGHTLFFISAKMSHRENVENNSNNILRIYIPYRGITQSLPWDPLPSPPTEWGLNMLTPKMRLSSSDREFYEPRLTVGRGNLLACVQWDILFYTTEHNKKSTTLRLKTGTI